MFGSTVLMTVGHALQRAHDEDLEVRIHLGGEWITGRVVSTDSQGVALAEANGDLCIVRSDAIAGVRLPAPTTPPCPTQRVRSERTDVPQPAPA